jgi:thiol-disulfide isomerase/thioredoxin
LVLLALMFVVHLWQTRDLAQGAAPELTGKLLDGSRFDLAAMRGRPVLVHFWATWCPVCRLQEESIEAIAQDHPVVTVAIQSGGGGDVAAKMSEEGLSFPVLVDDMGILASRWGVSGVPTSFVVDGAGRIAFVEIGYTSGPGLRARLALAGD